MDKKATILVVDDEQGIRDLLSYELGERGYEVVTAADGAEALDKIKGRRFHVAISDIKMPKMDGMELLSAVKRVDPELEVIMATGFATIDTAVLAMKNGAYDFVQKPFQLDEMFAAVERALERKEFKTLIGIYEASKAAFSTIKVDILLPAITQISLRLLKADEVTVFLAEDGGGLRMVTSSGQDDAARRQSLLGLGERFKAGTDLPKDPIVVSGRLQDDPRLSGAAGLENVTSSILYPLWVDGAFLGILNANRIGGSIPFNDSDLRTVTIVGAQIAQSLCNAKLYRRLEANLEELQKTHGQLKETQLQLVQSEKLAAVGQLAAGIAHELNNPLTAIMGLAEITLENKGLADEVRADMESMYQQCLRCRRIIQDLLVFGRKSEPAMLPVSAASLVKDVLCLKKTELENHGVKVIQEIDADLPEIAGDPGQLEQVFLNLITNAAQAMEQSEVRELRIRITAEGDKVVLRFIDTGTGMGRSTLMKAFDPFFTTKPVGKGTGLGLSISRGIIQQHGGTIKAEGEVGVGSVFTVELPVLTRENHGQ